MSEKCDSYQECCLYFTANSLARNINEMAEIVFAPTGLAPSYAYLMLSVTDEPGLSQNELAGRMNIKASTMTRFIDKLVLRQLVERKQQGRNVLVYPTESGRNMRAQIEQALKNLYHKYCEVLGEDFAVKLTADIYQANVNLRK